MDTQFLEEIVEFLVDQLHMEIEEGNQANAEALAIRIRELQEIS
jgi:hypothetical protein